MGSLSSFVLLAFLAVLHGVNSSMDEQGGKNYVDEIEEELGTWCNKATIAGWNAGSNITDETQKINMETSMAYANYKKGVWNKAIKFPWQTFKDPALKRRFKLMSYIGSDAMEAADVQQYTNVSVSMQTIYGTAKVPAFKDKTKMLSLTPDLERVLSDSQDYTEQEYIWKTWRDQSGAKMKSFFEQYVNFENKAAKLNGKANAYEGWTMPYDAPTFREDMLKLWKEIEPLYRQLHAYVRKHLLEQYPGKFSKTGQIPAHILGNMWGQSWFKVMNRSMPFKGKASVDITPEMEKQGYTPWKMFILADDFFSSIGFARLPFSFWRDSILSKPTDGRELQCHATAWDFCNAKDFRIRMCTQVTMKDLITAHHEVGHNIYHISYKEQIQYFRDGANDGFHEAIGDCIAYSVSTPKHLQKIGLLHKVEKDDGAVINYLYKEALDKIAFLPMALLIDTWRWNIFEGKVTPAQYNCHWWELRRSLQGLKPPCPRSAGDFDAGSKYHVPYGVPYIRYFISGIVQLQFHKALCMEAKEYDPSDPSKPLHNCDIYGSKAAGEKLKKMLSLGSSLPWQEALKQITGSSELSASALLEYFKPLYDWLVEDNKKTGEKIGWDDDGKDMCKE